MSSRRVATAVALILLVPVALPLIPSAAALVVSAPEPAPAFTFVNYPAPSPWGRGSGEPTIGVNWASNVAMATATTSGDVFSIEFDDTTSPPTALWQLTNAGEINGQINIDPILFTDAVDGRTYAGGLDGACSILAYTDDDGETWTPMTNSCAPPGWDHQTVFAGPWHAGPLKDSAVYPRAVYYCAQPGLQPGPAFCGVSQDGGLTFRDSVPMYELFECQGLHGKGKVSPDGTVGVPNRGCVSNAAAVISEDNGVTWTPRTLPGTVKGRFDPALAWTTDNWLYLGATGGDGRALIGMSKDKGVTWDTIKDVTPPGVLYTEFAQVIAGDNERAAFAFLGSEKGPHSPVCNNAGQQIWHMYVAMTYDGGLTWDTERITTDPVQRGPMGDPDNSACRNLLDFNDVTVDAEGRVLVAYTDGCTGACAGPTGTVASSNGGVFTIARQTTGRGLFAAGDTATIVIDAPLVGAVGQTLTLAATVDAELPYDATVNWGDGSPVESLLGQTDLAFSATHAYASTGEFDITVSIEGSDGSTASDTTTATVSDGGTGGSVRIDEPATGATVGDLVVVNGIATLGSNLAPVASYTFSVAGSTASFDASASSDPEGAPLAFTWAFGDTQNGGGAIVSHTYGSPGTYQACLTVSDGVLSDELCQSVTIGSTSTRTLLADDPQGDAKNPNLEPAGGGPNVPTLDIRKLEAEMNANGEPVFTLTIDSITTPTAPTQEAADGAIWRAEWTSPSGKTDFVQVSVSALGTVQGGYGDTDTNGIYSTRGAAPYTFTPGTPGKFTMTYPAAALTARGYSVGSTLTSVTGTTLIYQGSPQDVPISAGGTTQYDGTESDDYALTGFNAHLATIGAVSTQAAKPAPTTPPSDPQIVDGVSDPIGDNTPTLNIQSAWFDSDATNLYVGAKIQDIPADATTTAFLYYGVNFKPSWTLVDPKWGGAVGSAATFTGLRVTALFSPVAFDGIPSVPHTETATTFELQALSTEGAQSKFGTVADIQGTIDPTTDIIWWVVPRVLLQNPGDNDFITTTSAASAPAVGGAVTFGSLFGDSTGTGDDYVFPGEVIVPPTVTLNAAPASGVAPLDVAFSASASGAIASWTLDFGDNTEASGTGAVPASFTHTYESAGSFVATLAALATNGASGTGEATITVGSTPPPTSTQVVLTVPGLGPVDATCTEDCAAWSAELDLSSLDIGDLTIVATLKNNGATLATDSVDVTLARAPKIIITSPAGGADVASGDITIAGKITNGAANRPPSASMNADVTEGVAPLTVEFALNGADDEGIASWSFDSDDGNTVNGGALPATHTEAYAAPGTYHPTFTVTDVRGKSDMVSMTILVQATNTPPGVPTDPTPLDGATDVSVPAILGWSATDPDGNTLTYDVYLGTDNPPPLVATGQTASYLAGSLLAQTTYYWSVVAKDATSSTAGPVWSFTTAAASGDSEATKPHVVVALIDSGTNPYHEDFRRADLLENPSSYITGLPSSQIVEVDLCFFDAATQTVSQSFCPTNYNTALTEDASAWSPFDVSATSQTGAGQAEIAWFPGTNVMLVSFAHDGDAGYPGLDGTKGNGDSHGSWTSSNVGGLKTGTCPECIIVMIEGDTVAGIQAGYTWAANQPWIDIITSSVAVGFGACDPVLGACQLIDPLGQLADLDDRVEVAAQKGKLFFESSGNGIGNAGVAPTSTFLGGSGNPWGIPVGCSTEHTGQTCLYSDTPNAIQASGASRTSASPNTFTQTADVGGTSFSSPSSAGVAARALYAVRSALNDVDEGVSGSTKTLVRASPDATLPSAGPLANGALTRLELEEAVFKTARRPITPQAPNYIFPVEVPDTPLNFVKGGYGQVYRGDWGVNGPGAQETWSSSADITNVLLGNKPMPNRFLEETWWEEIVEPAQIATYGAEIPDTDTDSFPTDSPMDPSGLDGYTGASAKTPFLEASATVPAGTVPTPSMNRLYFHHNVVSADEFENYLNNVENPAAGNAACTELQPDTACPDWWGIGATGVAPAGNSITYTVAYPQLGGPMLLDATKEIVIHIEASGFAQPPTPTSIRATMTSAGALIGSGTSELPTLMPPFESAYEIRFKPTGTVLNDLVEVTIAWDGPVYSFHVSSQGQSWIDLPITASLPPVDYVPLTYYLDDLNAYNTNGASVTMTRDATKLAGDADKSSYWTFPQATGLVINLVSEDALATGPTLLASEGTAQVFMCTAKYASQQPEAGAAIYTAKLSLSVNGVPLGGGSITKQIVGPNDGRAVPVSIPLTLNPSLLATDVPIQGAITLSGPGGVFTENMGLCGGGPAHPWKITLGVAELSTTPSATIDTLPATISNVRTISGTASFPAVPGVSAVTWYAQDMNTFDSAHDSFTLATGGPGEGSGGPILEPSPDGWVLTYTSASDAIADASAFSANGVGTASFWVTGVPAATDVTVEFTILLQDGASQRLLGSGGLTKHIIPPLGTVSPLWDEQFTIGFTPKVTDPQPGEKVVMIVKVRNVGPATTTHISCLCGGDDMPVYVSIPIDASSAAQSPVVDVTLGDITAEASVADGAWSVDVDTRTIPNGDYTLSAVPRALYGGVSRTGPATTTNVEVSNVAVNTPPTASISVGPSSGPAPLAVTANLGGSDAQTDASLLTWSIDWGDGSPADTGTGLPAQATHSYAVGNHLATLTVTDGGSMIATASAPVSAFAPPPTEKVLVILDGGAPVEATDIDGDGSFRNWSASFSLPNAGVHSAIARHMVGDTIASEATIAFQTVGNVLDIEIHSPASGTLVGRNAAIVGGTIYNGTVDSVEASINDFATSVPATTSDAFATWSVDVDALGLPDDTPTLIAIRASSVDGTEYASVTLTRNAAPDPVIEIVTPLPVYTGESVQFQAGGTLAEGGAPIVSWAWNLGEGQTSTQANPVASYAQNGAHEVTLTVTDADGGVGVANAVVLVINRLPTVFLTTSPADPTTADVVTLSASGSDVDGSVVGYTTTAYAGPDREDGVLATGAETLSLTFPDNGEYLLVASAVDDDGDATETESLLTVFSQRPVALLTASPLVVGTDDDVTFDASASSDPDGTIVEYRFDPGDGSGVATFTTATVAHTYTTTGTYLATVEVVDDDGATATSLPVEIRVNGRPTLADVGNHNVDEGALLTFTLAGADAEGDALTYTVNTTPTGATLDPQTGVFSWTPTYGQSGYYYLKFDVTDGVSSASRNSLIAVGNVNLPPTLQPIGAKSGIEDSLLMFALVASDPDGEFTLSASPLPAGAGFDPATGTFGWTPNFTQAGVYTVTFTVTDGTTTLTEDVVMTIANNDRPTVLDPVASGTVKQLSKLTLNVHASDPDAEPISFAVSGPAGMTIVDLGNGNARIEWTPAIGQLGTYNVQVIATSGEGAISRTTTATALFKADLTMTTASNANVKAVPGQVISFTSVLKNTGPQTDTFKISAANDGGLNVTGVPDPITLAPGETAAITVQVTASAAKALTWTTITAMSLGDGSLAKSARFRYDIPVFVNVTVDQGPAGDAPSGTLHVTYLDGTNATGASVSIMQTPTQFGTQFRQTLTGTTDANGLYAWDFTNVNGLLPGNHALHAKAKLPGGSETIVTDSYVIGPQI